MKKKTIILTAVLLLLIASLLPSLMKNEETELERSWLSSNGIWNWEWLYGELPEGNYRIAKEIMDFRETGEYDTAIHYAEFRIE